MEINGRIIAVMPIKTGTSQKDGKPWASQDYVIETVEQYPKRMVFNLFGEDKITQYNLKVGDEVTVYFDINAREYNGRWYNEIRAWKVVDPKKEQNPAPFQPAGANDIPSPTAPAPNDPADALPF